MRRWAGNSSFEKMREAAGWSCCPWRSPKGLISHAASKTYCEKTAILTDELALGTMVVSDLSTSGDDRACLDEGVVADAGHLP